MIPSKFRIPKSAFPGVLKGTTINSMFFRVIISSHGSNHPKIAAVTSKKHAQTAVIRNRVRRTIYRVAQQKMAKLPLKSIVVMLISPVRPTISNKKQLFTKISTDIDQLFDVIIKKYGHNH